MTEPPGFRHANRRYLRIFWPLIATYVVLVVGGAFLVHAETTATWLKVVMAVLVTLPLAGVLWAMLRNIDETDEYTRLRQLTAFARGAAVLVAAIFLTGFLQIFGALERVPVFLFGPLFFLAYGFAFCFSGRGSTQE
jgi:hypothetical protein